MGLNESVKVVRSRKGHGFGRWSVFHGDNLVCGGFFEHAAARQFAKQFRLERDAAMRHTVQVVINISLRGGK